MSTATEPTERYARLVAQGRSKPKPVTAADRHSMPHYGTPEEDGPLSLLPAERAGDSRL